MKKVWKILRISSAGYLGILIGIVVVFHIFNLGMFTVRTDSMEPTIHVGGVIVVKKGISIDDIKMRDIVIIVDHPLEKIRNLPATHRVVGIHADPDEDEHPYLVTKGDGNEKLDSSVVAQRHIYGKVIFIIPWWLPLPQLNSITGMLLFVGFPLVLLIATFHSRSSCTTCFTT